MRRRALTLIAPCALALLAGCGSGQTRTVSVANTQGTPSSTASSTSSSPSSSSQTTTSASSSTAASTTGGQGEPAFVGGGGGGVGTAEGVLQTHGFRALDPSQYHAAQTLRVLIGARPGSAGAHVQQAFFFVGGRYLGTDTAQPSGQIRVVSQNDTEVTLAYALYRPGDPPCCARGGEATVSYQLDNGRLQPLGAIPSASPSASPSRQ